MNSLSALSAILMMFSSFEFFTKDIKIDISHSTKKGGPLFIKEQEDTVKQNAAVKNIKNNDSIKDFLNRFDATLKDKSIKPIN